jgi:hypothetical protein
MSSIVGERDITDSVRLVSRGTRPNTRVRTAVVLLVVLANCAACAVPVREATVLDRAFAWKKIGPIALVCVVEKCGSEAVDLTFMAKVVGKTSEVIEQKGYEWRVKALSKQWWKSLDTPVCMDPELPFKFSPPSLIKTLPEMPSAEAISSLDIFHDGPVLVLAISDANLSSETDGTGFQIRFRLRGMLLAGSPPRIVWKDEFRTNKKWRIETKTEGIDPVWGKLLIQHAMIQDVAVHLLETLPAAR